MYKKETRFAGCDLGYIHGNNHSPVSAELARYVDKCHAEIDRLSDELAALRSQPADERVWISSETHETFPESGIYFSERREDRFVNVVKWKAANSIPPGWDYTLLLAEADFPVPPKPEPELEVKVGKYRLNGDDLIAQIHCIKDENCFFETPLGEFTTYTVDELAESFKVWGARFIGEGDNQ